MRARSAWLLVGPARRRVAEQGEGRAELAGAGAEIDHAKPKPQLATVAAPGQELLLEGVRGLGRRDLAGGEPQFGGLFRGAGAVVLVPSLGQRIETVSAPSMSPLPASSRARA